MDEKEQDGIYKKIVTLQQMHVYTRKGAHLISTHNLERVLNEGVTIRKVTEKEMNDILGGSSRCLERGVLMEGVPTFGKFNNALMLSSMTFEGIDILRRLTGSGIDIYMNKEDDIKVLFYGKDFEPRNDVDKLREIIEKELELNG